MGWCTWRYLDFGEIRLHGMIFFDMIMGAGETKDPGNERIRIPAFQPMSKLWKRTSLKRITAVQSFWENQKNLGFSIKISIKILIWCSNNTNPSWSLYTESDRIFKREAEVRSFFLLAQTLPRLHMLHTLASIYLLRCKKILFVIFDFKHIFSSFFGRGQCQTRVTK